MLKIVNAPNEVLSQKAKPIEKIDKSIHKLIKDMEEALIHTKDPEGVGLAAPQVEVSLQLFLVKETPKSPTQVFINPKIEEYIEDDPEEKKSTKKSEKEKGVQLEGCLSLQDIWGVVKRAYAVVLSYQDETGKSHKKKFTGYTATIIQHEVDHLSGFLFTKRVLEQNNQLYTSKRNAKGENEYDPIEL